MKIEGVLQRDDYFYVTLKPTWWEKFMGWEEQVWVYKQVGKTHTETHDPIYIDKNGDILPYDSPLGEAINRFKRKKLFHDREVNLNMN